MLSTRLIRNTKYNKQIRRALLTITFFYGVFAHTCYGTPLNNVFDTQPIYTVLGTDKFYKERCQGEVNFYISPFYQQTSTARNKHGKKVPAGDRLGKWNLFGLFFGPGGAPEPLNFADPILPNSSVPNLRLAQKEIAAITSQIPVTPSGNPLVTDRYRIGPAAPFSANPLRLPVFPDGLANEENFDPNRDLFAYVTVPVDYEKIGVRSQLNFDSACGLGFSIKCGFVDVKQHLQKKSPKTLFVLEPIFARDAFAAPQPAGSIPPIPTGTPDIPLPTGVPTATANDQTDAPNIFRALFDFPPIDNITEEDLDFDLTIFHKTCAEDLHVQVYWHFPIVYKEKNGDTVLTMIPYIAAGAWLPTGSNYRSDKAFSVATGNDGFFGFTAEASLGFDFPILPKKRQTLQGNFGGGILLFAEKSKFNQRLPTNEYQAGFFPWRIDHLKKRPGLTWYFNGSMKSEDFIEGLSIYFDFMYTQHLKDHITLLDPNPVRNEAFGAALDEFVHLTRWKNQQVNIGFDYRLAELVSIGGAVQAHISGVKVYRSVTLLGSVKITF